MSTTLTISPRRSKSLPTFIEPMLASLHSPFESKEHFFETKWDGFRALAFIEQGDVRLVGRRKTDFTPRFPELIASLKKLPSGTVLDGEIIHLTDGRPDFHALLARERSFVSSKSPNPKKFARVRPVQFVAFDVLYERGTNFMPQPFFERRARLDAMMLKHTSERLTVSDGQVGGGLTLFESVKKQGLEGVMAKRLDSAYEPGARSGAWTKFKPRHSMPCVIIGYEPSITRGIKSLLIATDVEGELKFVGQVGSGISNTVDSLLLRAFKALATSESVVTAPIRRARWVRPELMCTVSFAEWTNDGKLRQPVFVGLIDA